MHASSVPTEIVADKQAPHSSLADLAVLIRCLRPKQWTKNLIIFLPAIFAGRIHELPSLLSAIFCFVAFCLVSSAIYVLNDIIDVEADRKHPTKCKRPIASGAISMPTALASAIMVGLSGLIIAAEVRPSLTVVLLSYVLLQIAYVSGLKQKPLIDIACIATGFVIRAISGAVAVHVAASAWFLMCTGLGAVFIALDKRRQEIRMLGNQAAACRVSLQFYSAEMLNRLESMVISALMFSYILYTLFSYHGQWMVLTIPLVLYGAARYIQISSATQLSAAPEDVLWKDRGIQLTISLWLLIAAGVVNGIIPTAVMAFGKYLDGLKLTMWS
jgi:4-hydroxybenzoate polyprenyltransferase